MAASVHQAVLPQEVIEWLAPQAGGTVVDGTLGGAGHTRLLAAQVGKQGLVIGLDRDPEVVARAENELGGMPVAVAHANYADLPEVLKELDLAHVEGILLDLGLQPWHERRISQPDSALHALEVQVLVHEPRSPDVVIAYCPAEGAACSQQREQ